MTIFPTLKKSFCWSPWCIRFQHCKGPWPQRTMTAKHNDRKAQWLQRTMTAKRNDRKERWLQENSDCNKAMTAKNRPLQRAVLEGSLARKLPLHNFNLQILKETPTKASFSHLQLADFEGSLARKLPLHNFNLQILKETRTKASFSHLQLADFEGSLARKLPLHNFNLQILKETRTKASFSHLRLADFEGRARAKAFLCTTSTCRFWKGSLARKLDQGDKMRRTTDLSLANQ